MAHPELNGRPSALDRKAQALARAMRPPAGQRRTASRKLSRGLGWLGIGLGAVQLLAARRVAQATGLPGAGPLVFLCGLREVASGVGLVAARSAGSALPWARTRVAGDAMDLAALAAAASMARRVGGGSPWVSIAAVAGVTLLDVACVRTLRAEASAARQSTDYSDRAGLRDAARWLGQGSPERLAPPSTDAPPPRSAPPKPGDASSSGGP